MTDRQITADDQSGFGTRVMVMGKLIRQANWNDGRETKTWEREPIDPPREAILIGVRCLSNGEIRRWGDEGPEYKPKEWLQGMLVVTSMKSKPFLVRPHDVVPL